MHLPFKVFNGVESLFKNLKMCVALLYSTKLISLAGDVGGGKIHLVMGIIKNLWTTSILVKKYKNPQKSKEAGLQKSK